MDTVDTGTFQPTLDWGREYLDYIMSVKIVDNIDEAIEHIYKYGTGHSECIVTENLRAAERFTAQVDAAAVYVNASTRFTDGGDLPICSSGRALMPGLGGERALEAKESPCGGSRGCLPSLWAWL